MPLPLLLSLGFALATLASLAGADRLVDAAVDTAAERQFAALEGEAGFEAIVLGTSHAAYGIDPAALEAPGFRPYVFATTGAGPLYFEPWYARFRARHPAPRVVILAMDWFWARMWKRLADDGEHLPWGAWAAEVRGAPTPAAALGAVYNGFALTAAHQDYQRRVFGERRTFEVLLDRYYRGGAPLAAHGYVAHFGPADPQYASPVLPGSREARTRLLDRLRIDGARVVVVQLPDHQPAPGAHAAEYAEVAGLARAYGWPYLDYNGDRRSALNDDRALFADWVHLNEHGRAAFAPVLRRDLEALGVVPPRAARAQVARLARR